MTDQLVITPRVKPSPVTLSPSAARRLLDLSQVEGRPVMLRVALSASVKRRPRECSQSSE